MAVMTRIRSESRDLAGLLYLQFLATSQGIAADISEDGFTLTLGRGTIQMPLTTSIGLSWQYPAAPPKRTEINRAVLAQFEKAKS